MLKRVRIVGFKSLADVTVELGPLTVLIGRSGTGKSNFVDALRFLRAFLVARTPGVVEDFGDWSRVWSATSADAPELRAEVAFDVPGIEGDFEYGFCFRRNAGSISFSWESLSFAGRPLFRQQDNRWAHLPELVVPPALDGRSVFGAITSVEEITIAYLALTTGLGCYDFPGTVFLDYPRQPSRFGSIERLPGLADRGENALQALHTHYSSISALASWREMRAAISQLNPAVKNITLGTSGYPAIAVSYGIGKGTLDLDIKQESEGFRRFLAHLLALYQTPPKSTLVFEEPEKGIHPGAFTTLAEQFRKFADRGQSQIILTTHSPQLLDHFEPDEIRVAELQNHVTRIGPLAPDQVESLRERLLLPGELLTVVPARIEPPAVPIG